MISFICPPLSIFEEAESEDLREDLREDKSITMAKVPMLYKKLPGFKVLGLDEICSEMLNN